MNSISSFAADTFARAQKHLSYVGFAGTAAALFSPALTLAAFESSSPIPTLANNILQFINTILIPLLIAIALVVFFWGIVKYIFQGEKGMKTIQSGVIGLVVMLCIWGIVAFIGGSLGITGSAQFTTPKIGQ